MRELVHLPTPARLPREGCPDRRFPQAPVPESQVRAMRADREITEKSGEVTKPRCWGADNAQKYLEIMAKKQPLRGRLHVLLRCFIHFFCAPGFVPDRGTTGEPSRCGPWLWGYELDIVFYSRTHSADICYSPTVW